MRTPWCPAASCCNLDLPWQAHIPFEWQKIANMSDFEEAGCPGLQRAFRTLCANVDEVVAGQSCLCKTGSPPSRRRSALTMRDYRAVPASSDGAAAYNTIQFMAVVEVALNPRARSHPTLALSGGAAPD